MKKLSKAQQAVVDRMRKGCIIDSGAAIYWLRRPNGSAVCSCWHSVVRSLIKRGVIEQHPNNKSETYRLTEQYKTAPATDTGEE